MTRKPPVRTFGCTMHEVDPGTAVTRTARTARDRELAGTRAFVVVPSAAATVQRGAHAD